MCVRITRYSQATWRDAEVGWDEDQVGLHLDFLMSSHIGTVVNVLQAGNMGMPQLSLLHWSLCLATHVKSSAKPIIEPWEGTFSSKSPVRFSEFMSFPPRNCQSLKASHYGLECLYDTIILSCPWYASSSAWPNDWTWRISIPTSSRLIKLLSARLLAI
jgi:hypothetical protein